jgi:hypothetical protein
MTEVYYRAEVNSRWSIGIYVGPSWRNLAPAPQITNPVLSASDVTDVRSRLVADPFLIRKDGGWYMFFEVFNVAVDRGEIAYATSSDGFNWAYQGVVLREPFHLSYPYVFAWGERYYMIPETRQDHSIRLYVADVFPHRWSFVGALVRGYFADATLVRHADRFWLFAQRGLDELRLFGSEHLEGPWQEHPCSPLYAGDRHRTRPGGRMLHDHGQLYRFAQDGLPCYGHSVRAFAIECLNESDYREREVEGGPVLTASRDGWNAIGMHHLDAQQTESGLWLAAVDGADLELIR